MGKDYGEPLRYDPDFNGPLRNRSCTDIIFLIIFVVFLGAWGFVGYYGIRNGDINKLLAPVDSKGRHCGLDAGVEDKNYLVFFDITRCLSATVPLTGCPTTQVCVKECPKETVVFDIDMTTSNFEQIRSKMVCTDEVNIQNMNYNEAVQHLNNGKCAKWVLQSQPVLNRCIGDLSKLQCRETSDKSKKIPRVDVGETCVRNPKDAQTSLLNQVTALDSYVGWIVASWVTFFTPNGRDVHILSSEIVNDLVQSRWYMLGALFAVVIICFIYILLLRWVVAPVVWFSIVGLVALLGFSLYKCYENYKYYLANPVNTYQTTNLKGYMQSVFAKHQTWLTLLIVLAIIIIIYVLVVIFLRKRITIAIALIKEGSKAVMSVKSTIFFPIFPWILQCAVIAYGTIVLMFLLSVGETAFRVVNLKNDTCDCQGVYTEDYVPCDPIKFTTSCHNTMASSIVPQLCPLATCRFIGFENPDNYKIYIMHTVNLLGFFWTMFFISGAADMILAGTFATWYWTFDKSRNLPFFTLTAAICRTLRYHLGTVAFGALILAIIRLIRVILEYIDHKLKKFDNPLTKCILCCCKCFFWCLESFMKFINKNAYIMCAVHGKNFCRSARDAFSLLMRNIVRVVVLDKVMDLIFFLSKLLISIGVGFAVFYLLKWKFVYEITKGEPLHYNYIPAIILSLATYLISTLFFNVYSMAVDTIFLCFLEDCERNDGSPEKKYYMSKNLMKILGKRNMRDKAE